jgi:membrane-associated protease RseP (regulator of RpoE activity)
MSYALGVIAFSVGLLLSVMLHEAGHFTTAKAFGMKASRFFVGFGPTLWSFRRGETEYGVKALPFGGFVKIDGMTSLEEIAPEDEARAFYRQPAGRRTIVLSAGSFVHFVIAILLVFGIIAATGQDPLHSHLTTTIDQVEPCVQLNANSDACTAKDPRAPALGKLQVGDKVESVDGIAVPDYTALVHQLQVHPGQSVTMQVLRDGKPITVTLTTVAVERDGKEVGKIGISPRVIGTPVSFAGAFGKTFSTLGTFITSTGKAITGLPHEVHQALTGEQRSDKSAESIVDVARVSGQISSSGAGAGNIAASLLLILAELNLFVGLFNLLPLLPLDGGHIAIVGFEVARSRFYRVIGRRDPGRVDIMKVLPLTYAVVAVFVGLSLILLYAGITNPIRLQ